MKNPNLFHIKAENMRESEHFEEALDLYNRVLLIYENEHNYEGVIEVLDGKSLTYKHLFLKSKDAKYLEDAKESLEKALELASQEKIENVFFRTYFGLGQIYALMDNLDQSIKFYELSISKQSDDTAEKGDVLYHLGEVKYKAGKAKEGESDIHAGIEMIKQHEQSTDPFTYKVWLSGAYKTLATLYMKVDFAKAKTYLDMADSIVQTDERLVIRKRQILDLKALLLQSTVE